MGGEITVTSKTANGSNKTFHDNYKNKDMTLNQFVTEIEKGNYPGYHVRKINGVKIPASNPDSSTNNNLG